MTTAFVIVVSLALLPQIAFTVLYQRWLPAWRKNPYGRLAQLGSWCHILLLSIYLILVLFAKHLNPTVAALMLILAFVPLIIFGLSQLYLLKMAVDSSRVDPPNERGSK